MTKTQKQALSTIFSAIYLVIIAAVAITWGWPGALIALAILTTLNVIVMVAG